MDGHVGLTVTDWEAIADREPDKLVPVVSSDILTGVSKIKLEDSKSPTPKRRGRGTFSYDKDKLYSDRLLDGSIIDDVEDDETNRGSEDKKDTTNCKYALLCFIFSVKSRFVYFLHP